MIQKNNICQRDKVNVAKYLKTGESRVARVAQSVKCLTLDFGSGHKLAVCEIKPHMGLFTDSMQPAWDSLSLSAPPSACTLSLSK